MNDTSKGTAGKGSKYWMQKVVNTSDLKSDLDDELGCHIDWISPLHDENYSEYRLNDICQRILIDTSYYDFWSERQPWWDAIGVNSDNDTLYLVEAKAHLKEFKSKLSSKSEKSIEHISKSMKEVFDKKYSTGNFDKWINGYYQLANRLAFLEKLNEISEETGKKVKLVLLNFVNDATHNPTSEQDFALHYKKILKVMTGSEATPKDVIMVHFPVDIYREC